MSKREKGVPRKAVAHANTKPVIVIGKNQEQKDVLKIIKNHDISIISGPAGCGKTALATLYGIGMVQRGEYEKIIFTRPCIEACGESLGYLPGNFNEKLDPYMAPIFEILHQNLDSSIIKDFIESKVIQTIPLAYQRGMTFTNAFVVGDEFQNTIPKQVRMLLTRMGEGSKIVLTGDIQQTDIEKKNGLSDALDRLRDIEEVGIYRMTHKSIVRHPIVEKIDNAYYGV